MMKIAIFKSNLDAHTLGIKSVASLVKETGQEFELAPDYVCHLVDNIPSDDDRERINRWLRAHKFTSIGFSYRLDPDQGFTKFCLLAKYLREFYEPEHAVPKLFFAGLPQTCERIKSEFGERVSIFSGDETAVETLLKLGINPAVFPDWVHTSDKYMSGLLDRGKSIIKAGSYWGAQPARVHGYTEHGTARDNLLLRIAATHKSDVLTRVHLGPYSKDRPEALHTFDRWCKDLAKSKHLDILSIGSSQLSQSKFEKSWHSHDNGGGVPINSRSEFRAIAESASPMLVRSYSGTTNVADYASMLNETINCAWHALSLWWFNQNDGRGPLDIESCIAQHLQALSVIAASGKPFEPNIAHHFSFRGSDDVTGIVATCLAVEAARLRGVRTIVLQVMLNTPKLTSAFADIAKYRALVKTIRAVSGQALNIIVQPRAGLSFFSVDQEVAKAQLAAVSGLMTDLDPNGTTPRLVHVVSYCEALELADPVKVKESIKITRHALEKFRTERYDRVNRYSDSRDEIEQRTAYLTESCIELIRHMNKRIAHLYTPSGLYEVYQRGYFAIPDLWNNRQEYSQAVQWETDFAGGGVHVMDQNRQPMTMRERISIIDEKAVLAGQI